MILVDTCVLLDIFTADPRWLGWSKDALQSHAPAGLAICDVVFAELSAAFPSVEAEKLKLVTRDCERYRTYFPEVQLICP